MSRSTFSGPVVSTGGFISGSDSTVAAVTAATLSVTDADHNGKLIPLSRAAGITATLPASSGSGAKYKFLITTSVTSNSTIIKVANATDVMVGQVAVSGTTTASFGTASTSDTITMNGSTQGGLSGSWIEVTDYAAGFWYVTGVSVGSGTVATPFSASVS